MKNLNIVLLSALLAFTVKAYSDPVSTAARAKGILEFHQAFIQNPQSLLMLHADISSIFINSNPRYEGFNNDLAKKLGLINNLAFSGLEIVKFSSEPLHGNPDQAYSVTFSEISFKDCIALSNHQINKFFIKVQINSKEPEPTSCEKEWLFQSSKNTLKYIGR